MISLIWQLLEEIMENRETVRKIFAKQSKYLNYDPLELCRLYSGEEVISPSLPFREELNWLPLTQGVGDNLKERIFLHWSQDPFTLTSDNRSLRDFYGAAYTDFVNTKGLPRDSRVVRLNSISIKNGTCVLNVSEARYSDQVRSNLVMDWQAKHPLNTDLQQSTLRSYFLSKYPYTLPPLDSTELANTIGIGTILFYRGKRGEFIPYLPKRSKSRFREQKDLAVYEGGYANTAAGALEYPPNPSASFEEVIVDDMYRELQEEVDIRRSEVEHMVPVALCREFLRGGKPEIFFAGVTSLTEEQLAVRRQTAIDRQKHLDKIEIEDSALRVTTPGDFHQVISANGLNLGTIANLFYAYQYLQAYLETES